MSKKPTNFNLWGWPYLRTNSGGDKEYACPHGVGHGGIHGCCGCCSKMLFLDDAKTAFKTAFNRKKTFPTKEYNTYRKLRSDAIKTGLIPPDMDD